MAAKSSPASSRPGNPINDETKSVAEIQAAMLEKHLPMIDEAGKKGVQILCLQEIFNGPYFCPAQDTRWYDAAEPVPGPDGREARGASPKKYQMAMVIPVYERELAGVYYNTAAVVDADGTYLGKYRKNHIPQTSGFWEKYFFKPGQPRLPGRSRPATRKIGVYICYDRHFPEGARAARAATAPRSSSTRRRRSPGSRSTCGSSSSRRTRSPTATSSAAINRVGTEAPWNIGKFYGTVVLRRPARQVPRDGSRGQGRAGRRRARPRHDRGGPPHLAVLPRSPARDLRRPWSEDR